MRVRLIAAPVDGPENSELDCPATLMDTVTVIRHGLDSPNPSCNWVTGRTHCGEASLRYVRWYFGR